MNFDKLKIKTETISTFNLHSDIEDGLKAEFQLTTAIDEQSVIVMSCLKKAELVKIQEYLTKLDEKRDLIMWVCYPKGTSKKFKKEVEVNRDDFFEITDNIRPVSLVALDEDWSAVRLRFSKYVKSKK